MKQVLDKQKVQGASPLANGASTSKLETLTRDGNVVYLDFAKKQIEQLDKLNKTVSDSLGDKGELSKTLKEIKKSVAEKPGAITEKVMGMGTAKGINATAGDTVKSTFKEKFGSLRGVLDTTGILKKGHNDTFVGGLMDKSLERREQKQQYIKDRVATQGSTFGSKKSFGETFEKSAKIQSEMQKNQETIKGLEDRGFKEGQIKRGGFYKKGVELEGQLAKVDTRFSDSFGGASKPADPKKPKVVKAADVEDPNSTKKRAKVVKPAANDESFSGTQSSGLGAADMTEADIENQKLMQEQTELLRAIAENTGGARKPNDAQKPKTESGGGGFLDGIMGMLGSGIMSAAKFLFNPKNLLKAFTKFLLPAMIIGSLVNGIIDGFKAFMETGSIAEALIAGFGGILSFLTFGLIDAKTIRSIVDWFSSFVTDYIIQPLKDFFGFLGESFDKYIAKPIMDAFSAVGDMLNEYIVEPIKKFFAPIADFFKNIKDQVFGFLEDFGIPEVGFTIPIIGKKVSIGPFYPFRPSEGTTKVGGNESLKQSSGAGGETSDYKQNIISTEKGKTNVLTTEEKVKGDKASLAQNMATFDPKTGKSYLSGDAGEKEISKNAFSRIKDEAKKGTVDNEKIKQIVAQEEAYDKLGFADKMKVKMFNADPIKLLAATEPQTGNKVAAQSAESEMAKNAPASSSSTVIAPMSSVNNNSSSTYAIKPPVRNPNQGVQNQMQKRYGT
jgi:hypothetical protein